MAKIVGPISGSSAPGAHIPSPFQDRTLTLEDAAWTEHTCEEELVEGWSDQLSYMSLSLPISRAKTAEDLNCHCGEEWNRLHHMEFIEQGEYCHLFDAICPSCENRAALVGEPLIH